MQRNAENACGNVPLVRSLGEECAMGRIQLDRVGRHSRLK